MQFALIADFGKYMTPKMTSQLTNDESGNGNNGFVTGATLTKDRFGQNNKAYSFDSNDFIDIGDIYVINRDTISISLWLKFQNNTHDNQFLTNGSIQDSDPNFFLLTYNNANSEKIRIATRVGEDWNNLYSNNKYTLNQWYHIVFTILFQRGREWNI